MEPAAKAKMADHLPFMLRLRGSQGLGSLIDEISLALHAPDPAELRLLASGLRADCFAFTHYQVMSGRAVVSATPRISLSPETVQ